MTTIIDWFVQQFVDDTTIAHLLLALLLGTVIGLERQWRQRTAGLRTNALVALGAASFVDLAHSVAATSAGVTQVIAYVVSGVGFLGAGAIMKEGTNIRGLNTAATIWCSAAVGAAAAAAQVQVAVVTTVGVVFLNVMMRWVLWHFEKGLVAAGTMGPPPSHIIRVACPRDEVARVRSVLLQALTQAGLTPTSLASVSDGQGVDRIQVQAELTGDPLQIAPWLEQVAGRLSEEPAVVDISWRLADTAKSDPW